MVLYLVKLTHKKTGLVLYKRGYTSKARPERVVDYRFGGSEFDMFNVELLDSYEFSHDNFVVARAVIMSMESTLNGVWPCKEREFNVEQYLGEQPGTLDNTGITEFIYLKEDQTEQDLVDHFKASKSQMWKVEKALNAQK